MQLDLRASAYHYWSLYWVRQGKTFSMMKFIRSRYLHTTLLALGLSTSCLVQSAAPNPYTFTKNNNINSNNATELKLLQNHFQQQRKQAGLTSKSIRVGDVILEL